MKVGRGLASISVPNLTMKHHRSATEKRLTKYQIIGKLKKVYTLEVPALSLPPHSHEEF